MAGPTEARGNPGITDVWTLAAVAVFIGLNRLHLTGHAPLWYIVLVTSNIWLLQLARLHPRVRTYMDRPATPDQARVAAPLFVLMLGFLQYGIGWGPVLVPCFAVVPSVFITATRGRTWRGPLLWSLVGIGAGQVAVQLGWAYSYIGVPQAHVVAAIGSLFVIFMTRSLAAAASAQVRAEHHLDALLRNSADMITVVDEAGTVRYQAGACEAVLGRRPTELLGTNLVALTHPDDVEAASAMVRAGAEAVEVRFAHADGSWRWCEARITQMFDDDLVRGAVLNIRDMSDRRTLEAKLRHQAFYDSLTGLPNRALFLDRLEQFAGGMAPDAAPVALLLIDLDGFKQVNDTLGHGAGDELLRVVGARLQAAVRGDDTVARLGGDEFAVLLHEWEDRAALDDVCARLKASLGRTIHVAGHPVTVTASIGLAVADGRLASIQALVREADMAMYASKAQGSGGIVYYDDRLLANWRARPGVMLPAAARH